MIQESDSPPYIIDRKNLKRFDERKSVFGRMLHDEKVDYYCKWMYDEIERILSSNQKGYSRFEFAKVMGAWAVYDYFHKAFSWEQLTDANSVMKKPTLEKYPISDKTFMYKKVKGIAKMYGASLVGITKINNNWIYSKNRDGKTIEIPKEFTFAIIMAIKMNPKAINTSPNFLFH